MTDYKTMIVKRIVIEPDRILLYDSDPRYHVIAPTDCDARAGDVVGYEPYGYNFGWFARVERRAAITPESDQG